MISMAQRTKSDILSSWDFMDLKKLEKEKPQPVYYFRLESEASQESGEETESVDSVQGKETDTVKDTSDTDSDGDYDIALEYDIPDDDDEEFGAISSSGEDEILLAAAAALYNAESSVYDEDSGDDSASVDGSPYKQRIYPTCMDCRKKNDNPIYNFCKRCYKVRKEFLPPRPRRHSKARKTPKQKTNPVVKLETLQSCIKKLSQDSGIGSSQDCPKIGFHQIHIPENVTSISSKRTSKSVSVRKSRNQISSKSSTNVRDTTYISQQSTVRNTTQQSTVRNTTQQSTVRNSSYTSLQSIAENIGNTDQQSTIIKSNLQSTITKIPNEENPSSPKTETVEFPAESRVVQGVKRKGSASDDDSPAKKRKPNSNTSTSDPQLISIMPPEASTSTAADQSDKDDKVTNAVPSTSAGPSSKSSSRTVTESFIESESNRDVETSDICMMCHSARKNGIFVHGSTAHMCCCYCCASKIYQTSKRCPICNRKAMNVLKLFEY